VTMKSRMRVKGYSLEEFLQAVGEGRLPEPFSAILCTAVISTLHKLTCHWCTLEPYGLVLNFLTCV